MTRRSWLALGAAVLAAGAAAVVLAMRTDRGSGDRSAAPPADAPLPRPPVDAANDAPPPTPAMPDEQRATAQRAVALLDEAIARAEQQLEHARAAGKVRAIRELEIDLERLRAARAKRIEALAVP
jgi:hypothetical protein